MRISGSTAAWSPGEHLLMRLILAVDNLAELTACAGELVGLVAAAAWPARRDRADERELNGGANRPL